MTDYSKLNFTAGQKPILPSKVVPKIPVKGKQSVVSPWTSAMTSFNISQPGIGNQVAKNLTPKQKLDIAKGTEEWMKEAPVQAGFMQGFSLNNPLNTLSKKVDAPIAEPVDNNWYTAGKVGGTIAQFAIPYSGAAKGVGTLTKAALPNLGKFGSKVAQSVATDIAVGLPLNINYAYGKEGLKGEEALKNIAFNTGLDLIAGGVLETLGVVLKSGKKVASKVEFDKLPIKEKEEVLDAIPKTDAQPKFVPTTKSSFEGELAKRIADVPTGAWNKMTKAATVTAKEIESELDKITKMSNVEWLEYARANNLGKQADGVIPEVPSDVAQTTLQGSNLTADGVSQDLGTTVPNAETIVQTSDLPTSDFTLPMAEKPTIAERLEEMQPKMGFVPDEMQPFDLTDTGSKVKSLGYNISEAFLNKQEFLESNVAKRQAKLGEVITQKETTQAVRNVGGKVNFMLDDGFVTKGGDVIPELSYVNLYNNTFKKYGKPLNDYMLHKHNMSRMSLKAKALENVNQFELAHPELAGLDDMVLKELKATSEEARIIVNEYQDLIKTYKTTKNKPVLKSSYEQSAKVVADMEKKNPELKSAADNIQKYWDKVMNEYSVGSFLSPNEYANLREMYPDYVPTYRVVDTLLDKFGAVLGVNGSRARKSANVPNPIKEATGSIDEVIKLADQYPMLISKYVRASRKNDAILNLYDSVAKNPEAFIDEAKVAGATKSDLNGETIDELVDSFDEIGIQEVKKGIFVLNGYRNGEKLSVQVNGRIFKEYKDLLDIHDDKDMLVNAVNGFTRAGHKLTDPFKSLVTGHNPLFATRNVTRDVPTRIIQSIENNPIELGKGLVESIDKIRTNHPDYQKFRATGAHMSGFYDVEKGFEKSFSQRNNLNDVIRNPLQKIWTKFGDFNETTEQVNRFAEYLHAIKKYGDTPEGRLKAMSDAAEVTTNFSRTGYATQVLNAWVPYLNAGVQGIRKSGSTLFERPISSTIKGLAVITVPAMIFDQINKDNPYYQQLDNRTKDTYFLIPEMGSAEEDGFPQKFIKIPKAREYGVLFANIFERARRAIDGEADPFKDLPNAVKTNFLPPTQDILKPVREALLRGDEGKDFAGRPIVPFALRGIEPYAQYDERTSLISKNLGEATKGFPASMQISPKKADYLINNYGSWIGQMLLGAASQNSGDLDRVTTAIGIPTKKSFEADSLFSNQNVTDFYELLDKANSQAATSNLVLGTPSAEKTIWEEKASAMGSIADAMTQITKAKNQLLVDKNLTPTESKEKIRILQAEYVKLAKKGAEIGRVEITPTTKIGTIEALSTQAKADKNNNYKVLSDFGTISMDSLVTTPQQLEKFNYAKKAGMTDSEILQGFAALKGLTKKAEKYQAIMSLNMSAEKKDKLAMTLVMNYME